ncbi:MAG: cupredoxin domain-containing protein [Nanoarchaeota archaeon]|nr:cupredoxin domain-containing protein [Nanoarchaeota archaeon]
MKNTTIAVIIGLVLVIGGIFFFANAQSISGDYNNQNSNTSQASQNGNVQKVVLSLKNYNYYPNMITVKAGEPVSISLDNSIQGCYRYFAIPQLNLGKALPTPSDTLDFTPTQKGTYRFQCGMGMGYGTLIVE